MDHQAFAAVKLSMTETPPRPAPSFDTLAAEASAAAGLNPAKGRSALVQALGLLDAHGDRDAMARLYSAVPGAEDAAASPEAKPRGGGGLFGGMMRSAGGVSGKAMADAMGLRERLKKQGLDDAALTRAARALRDRVKAATGRDLLGEALASVPGVGRLIAGD